MKKLYTLFLAVLAAPFFLAAQIWESQSVPFDEPLFGAAVSVVDADVAWMAAWQGDFSTSPWNFDFGAHHFARTTDGGTTWQVGTYPSTGAGYFSNLHALDANVAWVSFVDFGEGNKIFKTLDGGLTWAEQNVGVETWVNYVHFFDGTSGAVMGDPDAEGFMLFTTGDGGANWSRVNPADLSTPLPDEFGVGNMYVADGNDLWFVTNYGRVFHSGNRGYDWEAWDSPMEAFPSAIAARDGVCLVEIGDFSDTLNFVHQHHLFRTTDNGATWEDLTPADNTAVAESLTYIPGSNALVACWRTNNVDGPFEIRISYDDGSTWTTIDVGTRIYELDFVDGSTGYGTEYKNNGDPSEIYRYVGGTLTGLFEHRPLAAELDIFPNPTAEVARFRVDLPRAQNATVLLNDGQGRLVQRLEFEGEKTLTGSFDLSHLPAGSYSLTVATAAGMLARKVVKI